MQPPNLYKDLAISAPPSTVTRSEIVVGDLHSSSSINQEIRHIGAGHDLEVVQWPEIEDDYWGELGL